MFSKLALSNVRKSMKDYLIYFITLVFGVCLFYVFNSMGSQDKMMKLTDSSREILKILTSTMGYVSIFISIILGFLILYANKFLIKRRKKEFGLYMVLGMDKRKISSMLLLETLFIGVFALAVGLVIGVFASQGLAVITAKLMEVQLKQFRFTFSGAAAIKSIIYFGVIFLVVIVFNTISISRYKLIDLLTASRKNEKERTPRIWISVVIFIISLVCIGYAYHNLFAMIQTMKIKDFLICIILGAVGTLLLFYSLSGFMLRVVQSAKGIYYKGLNMFILRQISSKLSSTFISMTIISLMLLVAIATMSAGLGFSKTLTAKNDKLVPCDGSINFVTVADQSKMANSNSPDILKYLNEKGVNLSNSIKDSSQFDLYETKEIKYGDFLTAEDKKDIYGDFGNMAVNIIKLSDFNKEMKFLGKDPISLKENEYSILSTVNVASDMFEKSMDNKVKISLLGKTFTPAGKLVENSLQVEMVGETVAWVVLPDQYVTNNHFKKCGIYLNFNYKESGINKEKVDTKLYTDMDKKFSNGKQSKQNRSKELIDLSQMETKQMIRTAQVGIKTIASFFIIYVGIIFLISCAAILALQQLSESSDNVERYKLLRKLGVEEKMMKHSLFVQMAIYFLVPLTVAVVHSAVAIRFSTKLLKLFGETGVAMNTLFVAGFVVLIYGGYFIATYIAGKGIIRES